jgi:hypothetical protein
MSNSSLDAGFDHARRERIIRDAVAAVGLGLSGKLAGEARS